MPLSGPMIVHLITHLRERADYTATVGEWLICKLENGPESLIIFCLMNINFKPLTNCLQVISLEAYVSFLVWIGTNPSRQISLVEQTPCKEITGYIPSKITPVGHLLKRIERLSRRLNLPENLIATQAVALSNEYVKESRRVRNFPVKHLLPIIYWNQMVSKHLDRLEKMWEAEDDA